tara:strand:+ start:3059 stop:3874 length:816 start_codon:yes stop_codon:yes gene_type:complete
MARFVIGDIHGCFIELERLLEKMNFSDTDQLVFLGDYVARGPDSLSVLRLIKDLKNATCILGNHDLHLLYAYYIAYLNNESVGDFKLQPSFMDIFNAPDADNLLEWLRHRPLYHDIENHTFVHAGIFPHWTQSEAKEYASEVVRELQGPNFSEFFKQMYGNTPNYWSLNHDKTDRLRFITNAFTRMRYIIKKQFLDFDQTDNPADSPDLTPWYEMPRNDDLVIYFGHWASLQGKIHTQTVHSLDGGCVWGGTLMGMNIDTCEIFEVKNEKS